MIVMLNLAYGFLKLHSLCSATEVIQYIHMELFSQVVNM